MLTGRFFGLLSLLVVLGCAGYAALVLGTASWPEVAALPITYIYNWAPRPYTAAEFGGARWALGGLAAGAGLLLAGLARPARGRLALAGGGRALRQAARRWRASWAALAPGQRRLAWAALLALSLARLVNSLVAQPFDDLMSYELFVRQRLLVLSAAYPYPNNHLLTNTLSWLFYQVWPQFWWAMRLPVLLTSTVATAGWFLGLLRRTSFGVALGATAWFGLLHTSLYEASVGRGYWLQVGLGAVGFFALLVLQAPPGAAQTAAAASRRQVAGAGLVLSGILGLYAVPTHSFFLLSVYSWLGLQALRVYSWLGLQALRRRAGGQLRALAGLGGLTLVGAGLLYAPLLLLSGPGLLFHNRFVQPLAPAAFWSALPEAVLLPHRLLDIPLVLGVLGGTWALGRRAGAGGLPPGRARWLAALAGPSAWLLVVPHLVALVGLVYPPERTFFYKAQYLCILGALLVDWGWHRATGRRGRRWRAWGLAGGTLLVGLVQLGQLQRQERSWRNNFPWWQAVPAGRWLASQRPGPLLVPDLTQFVLLRFYTQRAQPGWQGLLDHRPRPGVRYRYLVAVPHEAAVPGAPPLVGCPAFENEVLAIYRAP